METEVLQVCGKAGRACRDVWSASALAALPAAGTPSSRLEVTCRHITPGQTHQGAQLLLGLQHELGN